MPGGAAWRDHLACRDHGSSEQEHQPSPRFRSVAARGQVSRVANRCLHACCAQYPGVRAVRCRLGRSVPAAFTVCKAARRTRWSFRGLLGLHSRYGPHACSPAFASFVSGASTIRSPSRLPDSYRGAPTIPRAGLSPAASIHVSRHTCKNDPVSQRPGRRRARGHPRTGFEIVTYFRSVPHVEISNEQTQWIATHDF
jgi:hypothetical protein